MDEEIDEEIRLEDLHLAAKNGRILPNTLKEASLKEIQTYIDANFEAICKEILQDYQEYA